MLRLCRLKGPKKKKQTEKIKKQQQIVKRQRKKNISIFKEVFLNDFIVLFIVFTFPWTFGVLVEIICVVEEKEEKIRNTHTHNWETPLPLYADEILAVFISFLFFLFGSITLSLSCYFRLRLSLVSLFFWFLACFGFISFLKMMCSMWIIWEMHIKMCQRKRTNE